MILTVDSFRMIKQETKKRMIGEREREGRNDNDRVKVIITKIMTLAMTIVSGRRRKKVLSFPPRTIEYTKC